MAASVSISVRTACSVALCAAFSMLCLVGAIHGWVAKQESDLLRSQSVEEAQRKSVGCIVCHSPMDEPTMHPSKTVQLGCTDCHGGDSSRGILPGTNANSTEYSVAKQKAHVHPRDPFFRNRGAVPPE